MTAPAFEEVPMPPTLPQSLMDTIGEYGMARTDRVSELTIQHRWELLIVGIKDYARAYGDQRANAALEEAEKLRKLIADHNDECVRMCDSRFANGPTQCPMRAYNRQCTDCPKDGMVEVPEDMKGAGA